MKTITSFETEKVKRKFVGARFTSRELLVLVEHQHDNLNRLRYQLEELAKVAHDAHRENCTLRAQIRMQMEQRSKV